MDFRSFASTPVAMMIGEATSGWGKKMEEGQNGCCDVDPRTSPAEDRELAGVEPELAPELDRDTRWTRRVPVRPHLVPQVPAVTLGSNQTWRVSQRMGSHSAGYTNTPT